MLGRARAVDAGVVGGIADVAEIDEEREAPAEEKLTLEIEEELFGTPRVGAGLDTASGERGLAVEAAVVPVGAKIEFRAGEAEAPVVGGGTKPAKSAESSPVARRALALAKTCRPRAHGGKKVSACL